MLNSNSKGFVKADKGLMSEIIEKLDLSHYATYLVILSFRNYNDNRCFPSISTLAQAMHVSTRTVSNKLDGLYKFGFIDISSGKQGVNSSYYFPKEDFYDKTSSIQTQAATRRKKPFKKKKLSVDEELKLLNSGYVLRDKNIEKKLEQLKNLNIKDEEKSDNIVDISKIGVETDDCDNDDLESYLSNYF